jgi:hypothetical protein
LIENETRKRLWESRRREREEGIGPIEGARKRVGFEVGVDATSSLERAFARAR